MPQQCPRRSHAAFARYVAQLDWERSTAQHLQEDVGLDADAIALWRSRVAGMALTFGSDGQISMHQVLVQILPAARGRLAMAGRTLG